MPKPTRTKTTHAPPDTLFARKRSKPAPHQFVLDALESFSPETRPMFGCLAVYVADKIVLILRDRPTSPADNGVWLATTVEHHASLKREFPSMRSIGVLGKEITGWQVLPADSPDFEESATHACELVLAKDPRIGKIPKSGSRPGKGERASFSAAKAKKSKKRPG